MAKIKGRMLPVSPFRQLVADLMHFSAKVPTVCMDRMMDLGKVQAARQRCPSRPCWTAIFCKAFGLAAQHIPDLRRVYMSFPWPHLYEHPHSIATVNIEREWQGELVVFHAQVRSPEAQSLAKLDSFVHYLKDEPVAAVKYYRRIMNMMRVPWPLRKFVWWCALNLQVRRRVHNFGTFGISTTAAHGAGIMKLVPMLTATLHYSLFDASNSLQMRLSFDHRVLDGATAAKTLAMMDDILHHEILDELLDMGVTKLAA